MISFEHQKNGCASYISPDVHWACEQVVPEDVNDVSQVDASALLSVEGNDGSVAVCFVCDDFEGNNNHYQMSVTQSNWLTVFDVDGRYLYEKCDVDVVGVVEQNLLVKKPVGQ